MPLQPTHYAPPLRSTHYSHPSTGEGTAGPVPWARADREAALWAAAGRQADFALFGIDIALTPAGLARRDDVGRAVMGYLRAVRCPARPRCVRESCRSAAGVAERDSESGALGGLVMLRQATERLV